jgi:hypothetical protein
MSRLRRECQVTSDEKNGRRDMLSLRFLGDHPTAHTKVTFHPKASIHSEYSAATVQRRGFVREMACELCDECVTQYPMSYDLVTHGGV